MLQPGLLLALSQTGTFVDALYAQISPYASILATRVAWSLSWLDFHQLDNACLWARYIKKETFPGLAKTVWESPFTSRIPH